MSTSNRFFPSPLAYKPLKGRKHADIEAVEPAERKPSKEVALPGSADDMVLEIETRLKADIENEVKRKHKAKIDQAIEDYYTKQAKKMFRQIWRECKHRTGHTYQADKDVNPSYYDDKKPMICSVCNHPIGRLAASRAQYGFMMLGKQLRAADQRAGTEWIPKNVL